MVCEADSAIIPSMTTSEQHLILTSIGTMWTGQGHAVECGSWFGASAVALARGLKVAGYSNELHLFDYFRIRDTAQVDKATNQGIECKVSDDLIPYIRAYLDCEGLNVCYHVGDIRKATWTEQPIEIFVLDAIKHKDFKKTIRRFLPWWIPGVTIVALMDYYYYRKIPDEQRAAAYREQERFINRHSDAFNQIDNSGSAVFFRYIKEI